jgi:xanthine dehydrogenase YagT iron-sulfur-binding subunit
MMLKSKLRSFRVAWRNVVQCNRKVVLTVARVLGRIVEIYSNRDKVKLMRVNGTSVAPPVDVRTSLLDHCREHLHLTGPKKGCNQGACGACTVLVDGQRILACLALAVQYDGCDVVTIEGLGQADNLHPLQKAFIDNDGFQCGYCTPGQICSAVGMIAEVERGVPSHVTANLMETSIPFSGEEMRERMSGNLCRCGAYNGIIDAISSYAEAQR